MEKENSSDLLSVASSTRSSQLSAAERVVRLKRREELLGRCSPAPSVEVSVESRSSRRRALLARVEKLSCSPAPDLESCFGEGSVYEAEANELNENRMKRLKERARALAYRHTLAAERGEIHSQIFHRQRPLQTRADAIVKLQSLWRQHRVFKQERRRQRAAVVVQAVYRGNKDRGYTVLVSERAMELEAQEAVRLARRFRLKALASELDIIRSTDAVHAQRVRKKLAQDRAEAKRRASLRGTHLEEEADLKLQEQIDETVVLPEESLKAQLIQDYQAAIQENDYSRQLHKTKKYREHLENSPEWIASFNGRTPIKFDFEVQFGHLKSEDDQLRCMQEYIMNWTRSSLPQHEFLRKLDMEPELKEAVDREEAEEYFTEAEKLWLEIVSKEKAFAEGARARQETREYLETMCTEFEKIMIEDNHKKRLPTRKEVAENTHVRASPILQLPHDPDLRALAFQLRDDFLENIQLENTPGAWHIVRLPGSTIPKNLCKLNPTQPAIIRESLDKKYHDPHSIQVDEEEASLFWLAWALRGELRQQEEESHSANQSHENSQEQRQVLLEAQEALQDIAQRAPGWREELAEDQIKYKEQVMKRWQAATENEIYSLVQQKVQVEPFYLEERKQAATSIQAWLRGTVSRIRTQRKQHEENMLTAIEMLVGTMDDASSSAATLRSTAARLAAMRSVKQKKKKIKNQRKKAAPIHSEKVINMEFKNRWDYYDLAIGLLEGRYDLEDDCNLNEIWPSHQSLVVVPHEAEACCSPPPIPSKIPEIPPLGVPETPMADWLESNFRQQLGSISCRSSLLPREFSRPFSFKTAVPVDEATPSYATKIKKKKKMTTTTTTREIYSSSSSSSSQQASPSVMSSPQNSIQGIVPERKATQIHCRHSTEAQATPRNMKVVEAVPPSSPPLCVQEVQDDARLRAAILKTPPTIRDSPLSRERSMIVSEAEKNKTPDEIKTEAVSTPLSVARGPKKKRPGAIELDLSQMSRPRIADTF